ncbi:hypothetical protein GIB67_029125 [Kingdonia uniflora]|uniref:Uncharacterized protein n=1 Tax=Kingdonia uniflora TaxID=39325 RepID=A0A7J7NIV3_9MAGN|nr:hypothetical protein GIB67_029125 [Kingdonia uniflora]
MGNMISLRHLKIYETTNLRSLPEGMESLTSLRSLSKFIIGVNKLADLVGVTLGPKGRNVVLENKYGSPKIINNGVTVAKEVELEDLVKNIGVKLVRQGDANTNGSAGDGTTTSIVLAQGLIAEGVKVVVAGANPVQITRGVEKTTKALVVELKLMSKEVEDSELADVTTVSVGNNYEVGQTIVEAMSKMGRKGIVTLEEGKILENSIYVVEGMQFDRDYIFPYFVINSEKITVEFENSLKAPGSEERKTEYLNNIATLTGGPEEAGQSLDKPEKEVLGHAVKVVLTKEVTTIVGNGSTQDAIAEQDYEKEKLNERIAKLSGGVVVIQVGAQTETELKEKKLRVEDALNATKVVKQNSADTVLLAPSSNNNPFDTSPDSASKQTFNSMRRTSSEPVIVMPNVKTNHFDEGKGGARASSSSSYSDVMLNAL